MLPPTIGASREEADAEIHIAQYQDECEAAEVSSALLGEVLSPKVSEMKMQYAMTFCPCVITAVSALRFGLDEIPPAKRDKRTSWGASKWQVGTSYVRLPYTVGGCGSWPRLHPDPPVPFGSVRV